MCRLAFQVTTPARCSAFLGTSTLWTKHTGHCRAKAATKHKSEQENFIYSLVLSGAFSHIGGQTVMKSLCLTVNTNLALEAMVNCFIQVPISSSLSIKATKSSIYFWVIHFHSLQQFSSKNIKEILNQGYFGEKKIKNIVEIYIDSAPEDISW